MRFLLDQNLPVRLIDVLSELGHNADHVRLLGLAEASDRDVWAAAVRSEAVMVSKDADFLIMAGRGAALVRLRIGNASNAALYDVIRAAWPHVIERLLDGETIVELRG